MSSTEILRKLSLLDSSNNRLIKKRKMIKRITILMLLLFPFSAIFAQVDDKQKEENEKKAQKANELYSKCREIGRASCRERV